jgi:type IV pilus assembly protein PilA
MARGTVIRFRGATGRAAQENGVTLIELLVAVAIVGSLAALALATFGGQRARATDAQAKVNLTMALEAMEAYFVENGTYVGANTSPPPDPRSLLTIEPALSEPPVPSIIRRGSRSYRMQVISLSDVPVTYDVRRRSTGAVIRTCTPVGTGGCPPSGMW